MPRGSAVADGGVYPPHVSIARSGTGSGTGDMGSPWRSPVRTPQHALPQGAVWSGQYASVNVQGLKGVRRISAERPSEDVGALQKFVLPPPAAAWPEGRDASAAEPPLPLPTTPQAAPPGPSAHAHIQRLENERDRLREQLLRERERGARRAPPSPPPRRTPGACSPFRPDVRPEWAGASDCSPSEATTDPASVSPSVDGGSRLGGVLADRGDREEMRCVGAMAEKLARAREEMARMREECGDFGVKRAAARADAVLRSTEDDLWRLGERCVRRDEEHLDTVRGLTLRLCDAEDEKKEVTDRLRHLIASTSTQLGSLRDECASHDRQLAHYEHLLDEARPLKYTVAAPRTPSTHPGTPASEALRSPTRAGRPPAPAALYHAHTAPPRRTGPGARALEAPRVPAGSVPWYSHAPPPFFSRG